MGLKMRVKTICSLVLVIAVAIITSSCGGGECPVNPTPSPSNAVISIGSSGVIPVFSNSESNNYLIPIVNNTDKEISGISYTVAGNYELDNQTLKSYIGRMKQLFTTSDCSVIPAHSYCLYQLDSVNISTNDVGSFNLIANYNGTSTTQTINYQKTVLNDFSNGVSFLSGAEISSLESSQYFTLYAYNNSNESYIIDDLQTNQSMVEIVNPLQYTGKTLYPGDSIPVIVRTLGRVPNDAIIQLQVQSHSINKSFNNFASMAVVESALTIGALPIIDSATTTKSIIAYVTNSGNTSTKITQIMPTNLILNNNGTCQVGQTLPVGQTCTIMINPPTAGSSGTGSLLVTYGNQSSAQTITWTSSDNPFALITFSQQPAVFYTGYYTTTVAVNNISNFPITNPTSKLEVSIGTAKLEGIKLLSDGCVGTIMPNTSCLYQITISDAVAEFGQMVFKIIGNNYQQSNILNYQSVVNNNAANINISASVPSLVTTSNGTSESSVTYTLINTGNAVANIQSISYQGQQPNLFVPLLNTCTNKLDIGSSCQITYRIIPTTNIALNGVNNLMVTYGGGVTSSNTLATISTGYVVLLPNIFVTSGYFQSGALDVNGLPYWWGWVVGGIVPVPCEQCGGADLLPTPIVTDLEFSSLSGGYAASCGIVVHNGGYGKSLYCWGNGKDGALGNGATGNSQIPIRVNGNYDLVSTGYRDACAIESRGYLWCWGRNQQGQLGIGSFTNQSLPVQVSGNIKFKTVSASYGFTCGIDTNGSAWCWGDNEAGQLGNGTTLPCATANNCGSSYINTPQQVVGGHKFIAISASGDGFINDPNTPVGHTCAIDEYNDMYCWGWNNSGQLGLGTTSSCTSADQTGCISTPQKVVTATKFSQVITGAQYTCGIDLTNKAWCFGLNVDGQLGIGSYVSVLSPTLVAGGSINFKQLAASYTGNSCGVDVNNQIWCWGKNNCGQLGYTNSMTLEYCASGSLPSVYPYSESVPVLINEFTGKL